MEIVKKLIKENTGVDVEVLKYGYDSTKKLHYFCCLYDAGICYAEILKNGDMHYYMYKGEKRKE